MLPTLAAPLLPPRPLRLRYHAVTFRSAAPSSIRLLGLESSNVRLRSLLHEATGLPIDTRSVFEGFAGNLPTDDGGWAAALGLALTFAPAPIAAEPLTTRAAA